MTARQIRFAGAIATCGSLAGARREEPFSSSRIWFLMRDERFLEHLLFIGVDRATIKACVRESDVLVRKNRGTHMCGASEADAGDSGASGTDSDVNARRSGASAADANAKASKSGAKVADFDAKVHEKKARAGARVSDADAAELCAPVRASDESAETFASCAGAADANVKMRKSKAGLEKFSSGASAANAGAKARKSRASTADVDAETCKSGAKVTDFDAKAHEKKAGAGACVSGTDAAESCAAVRASDESAETFASCASATDAGAKARKSRARAGAFAKGADVANLNTAVCKSGAKAADFDAEACKSRASAGAFACCASAAVFDGKMRESGAGETKSGAKAQKSGMCAGAFRCGAGAADLIVDACTNDAGAADLTVDACTNGAGAAGLTVDACVNGAGAAGLTVDACVNGASAMDLSTNVCESGAIKAEFDAVACKSGASTTDSGADAYASGADVTDTDVIRHEKRGKVADFGINKRKSGADVPEIGMNIHGSGGKAADLDGIERQSGANIADMCGSGAGVTDSGADMCGSGADVADSGADMCGSGADMAGSGTDARGSGADTADSGADACGSGADAANSGADACGSGDIVAELVAEVRENGGKAAYEGGPPGDGAADAERELLSEIRGLRAAAMRDTSLKLSDRLGAASALEKSLLEGVPVADEERARFRLPADAIGRAFVDINRRIVPNVSYIFTGGRCSGKSSFIALKIIEIMLGEPTVHACAVRKLATTLRDSVYAQFEWAIRELGLTDKFRFKYSPLEIVYIPTGQTIFFRGVDDAAKLKSTRPPFGTIGILWREEADQLSGPDEARGIAQSVLRGGGVSYDFSSYNPPRSKKHWINTLPDGGAVRHHSTYLELPEEWVGRKFIDDAEHLREVDPAAYEHEYLGVPNGVGGAVFEKLEVRRITDEEIAAFDRIYQGIDFGWYPDPFAFLRLHYDAARERIYLIDELYGNKIRNSEAADFILSRGYDDERIVCDSAEPRSIAELRRCGVPAVGAVKGAGSVAFGFRRLAAMTIVVDPARTPKAYAELAAYELTPEGDYPDRDDHAISALRYATERIRA